MGLNIFQVEDFVHDVNRINVRRYLYKVPGISMFVLYGLSWSRRDRLY